MPLEEAIPAPPEAYAPLPGPLPATEPVSRDPAAPPEFYHPEPEVDLRFICPYGLSWPALLPLAARSQLVAGARAGFHLNPRFHCQFEPPPNWSEKTAAIGYSDKLPVCWVRHPLYGYPEAYWPEPGLMELLEDIGTGRKPIDSLAEDCFALLSLGQLLVLNDEEAAEQTQALQHHWRTRLAHEQYLHLPNLISPLQVAALRAYTRARRRIGPLQWEHDSYTRRFYRVHDPVMRFWHQHMLGVLQHLIAEKIRASYSVISYYQETDLKSHCDREPCIWNLSIQLDSRPDSGEAAPWPLFLRTRHGDTPILLQAGDGLIYRGREMEHWREPLPPGREETVLLFHFVDEAYQGRLW